MKILTLISRILLGLVFTVFGSNAFIGFIPVKTLPPGLAGQFVLVLLQSHYVWVVGGFQLIAGILLLANRYVPLAVAILAPILVNILAYHILMDLKGLPLAAIVAILWAILAYRYRQSFSSIFVLRASPN